MSREKHRTALDGNKASENSSTDVAPIGGHTTGHAHVTRETNAATLNAGIV